MSIRNALGRKKYLMRIIIFISAIMLVFIIAFSGIIYFQIEKNLVEDEINNGKKILTQMKNNIMNIDNIVRSICLTNFYSDDIRSLMYLKDEDSYVEINVNQKLIRSIITTNKFIQSVYIYNNNRKIYFSTTNPFYHEDDLLNKKIGSMSSIPVLNPVLRDIEIVDSRGVKNIEQVISYFYYEQTDQSGNMDGAVIVSIKLDWIFANINEVDSIEKNNNDWIVLISSEGELVEQKNSDRRLPSEIEKVLKLDVTHTADMKDSDIGTAKKSVDGKEYLFTCIKLPQSNIMLYKIRSFDEIYSSIENYRTLIVLVTISFVLLGLLATVFVSGLIYMPMSKLIDQMRNDHSYSKDEGKDEISFIRDTINSSNRKLEKLYSERNSNIRILKSYFLMRLLQESFMINKDELAANYFDYGITLETEGKYAVCVLKIDRYKSYKSKHDENDRRLFILSILRISAEAFASEFRYEIVNTQEDQIVVIMNVPCLDSDLCGKVECLLNRINQTVYDSYSHSLSASISEVSGNYENISKLYQKAAANLVYRYTHGLGRLITCGIESNNQNIYSDLNFEKEGKFLDAVKKGDIEQAEKRLSALFYELREVNYNDAILYTTHLTNVLRNLICEINENRKEPVDVIGLLSVESLQEMETLDELHGRISQVLEELLQDGGWSVNEKQRMLAETIKDIIDNNYHKTELGAAFIAEMLKLSPIYIGKVFNEYFKMSLPEYVTDVRMSKAVEWLKNSKLSINQVMLRVGIDNQSYFYKLFKKRFGATPRDYIHGKI